MPLGDSITYGVGSSDGGGYREPLMAAFPGKFVTAGPNAGATGSPDVDPWYWNAGYPGFTSNQLNEYTNGSLADLFDDFPGVNIVTLHCGTNDPESDPNVTVNNTIDIVNNFFARRASSLPLYFFVMLPILGGSAPTNAALNAYITAVRPLLSAALTGLGNPNVYIATPPTIPDGDYLGGAFGIHPLDSGYALMVDDGSGNGWKPAFVAAGL
jgi:hypothetical protein